MVSAICHWFQLFYFLTRIIPVTFSVLLISLFLRPFSGTLSEWVSDYRLFLEFDALQLFLTDGLASWLYPWTLEVGYFFEKFSNSIEYKFIIEVRYLGGEFRFTFSTSIFISFFKLSDRCLNISMTISFRSDFLVPLSVTLLSRQAHSEYIHYDQMN